MNDLKWNFVKIKLNTYVKDPEDHPIAGLNISLLDPLAVDGNERRVVGKLGVGVDPQGVAGRRLGEHVVGQVRAEESSRNHVGQQNLRGFGKFDSTQR